MSYYVFAVIHLPDDLSLSLNMIQVFVGYASDISRQDLRSELSVAFIGGEGLPRDRDFGGQSTHLARSHGERGANVHRDVRWS